MINSNRFFATVIPAMFITCLVGWAQADTCKFKTTSETLKDGSTIIKTSYVCVVGK